VLTSNTGKKVLTVAISVVVSLFVCEGITRLFYRPTLLDPAMLVARHEELLPFGLKPNYRGYYVGGNVSVDGEGNRLVRPSCSGAKTVMVVGDSVAFGQGLNDDQTMASQLQTRLCGHYQVKNLVVPGYSSWNEYAAVRDYSGQVDQLILIYIPNDVTFNNDHFNLRHKPLGELADDRAHSFLRFLYSHVYLSFLVSDGVKRLVKRSDRNWIYPDGDDTAIQYSMQAIERLRELCRDRRINFSVAVYRDVWHYAQPEESDRYENAIRKNLEDRGVHEFVLKAHTEKLTVNEARLCWNDPHPSARAVELIVDDLMKEIDKQ
jgi:hypothetical protein